MGIRDGPLDFRIDVDFLPSPPLLDPSSVALATITREFHIYDDTCYSEQEMEDEHNGFVSDSASDGPNFVVETFEHREKWPCGQLCERSMDWNETVIV